jgi:hypothetical protein
MAKKLTQWPAAKQMHPWDTYFNGKIWELQKGVDFNCSLQSMNFMIYKTAKKRGHGVRIKNDRKKETLIVQAILPNEK